MVSFKEFMERLIDYLIKNDKELFRYLDNCFRTDKCDKDRIVGAFDKAYMHYLFFGNIETAAEIIRNETIG